MVGEPQSSEPRDNTGLEMHMRKDNRESEVKG